jgi:NitT/TauT family transport system substrate-binding protein
MKKTYIILAVIIIAVLGVSLTLFGISNAPKSQISTEPIRIGVVPWIGHGLYYIAKEKGFFEKEQLNVEVVPVDDSGIGKQLIATNKIDALSFTPETVVLLADAGIPIKAIVMTDRSEGADGIIVSQGIQDIADLQGKTVAFEVGSSSHFLLSYLLDKKRLTTNDLTVVNTIAPDAGAAFVSGKVDAAVTWEPWLSKAGEREGGRLLATSKETPILPAILIFRSEVTQNRPEDIQAVLRALFAARQWILANQTEATAIIARSFGITEPEVAEQLPTFRWLSYEDNVSGFTEGEYSAQNLVQTAGDLWLKLGLIKNKIDAQELVDDSLIKNLYE